MVKRREWQGKWSRVNLVGLAFTIKWKNYD